MRYLEITGGIPLHGTIDIQGSKNAVLPVLAACMLGDAGCVIENCPRIKDVEDFLELMSDIGCEVNFQGHEVTVAASELKKIRISKRAAIRIRSSILFLGTLLGKMGTVVLPMPGGCVIGARPVDLHLESMRQLGAEVSFGTEYLKDEECTQPDQEILMIHAEARCLCGTKIHLKFPSVGATENVILAAVMASGVTILENAAREPEIDELCSFLNLRGAKICRRKDGSIRIVGVKRLYPVRYRMHADRIVAGTYLLAAAATGGSLYIRNFPEKELESLLGVMHQAGSVICKKDCGICLKEGGFSEAVEYLETGPYPGFPTDLQSQMIAALCLVPGRSCICETVFEKRFEAIHELKKMGADIWIEGSCAKIRGVPFLQAARMQVPDLRGGAALVIGALQACGCTEICQVEYIERGYEDICRDLCSLGARICMKE